MILVFNYELTSEQPSSHLQGTVLGHATGCQRGIILQWAPSEQHDLILNRESFQSLDMGLENKVQTFIYTTF